MSFTLNVQETRSSIEVGQTAKGVWYIKSIKVYFQKQSAEAGAVVNRIASYKHQLESMLALRNAASRPAPARAEEADGG